MKLYTYVIKQARKSKSETDRKQYLSLSKYLLQFIQDNELENMHLIDINYSFCEDFKLFILDAKSLRNGLELSQNSKFVYYQKFRKVIKELAKEDLINGNLLHVIGSISPEETNRSGLSESELIMLQKTPCDSIIKNACMLSAYASLRFRDIKNLCIDDIKDNVLVIRQQKTKKFVNIPLSQKALSFVPKRINILYTPPTQKNLLENSVIKKDISFFVKIINNIKYPFFDLDYSNSQYRLKKWGLMSGVKSNIHWHIFRHTFAMRLHSNGVELNIISSLLGHKKLTTTQIYVNPLMSYKQNAVNLL